jgi:hypothetical protein
MHSTEPTGYNQGPENEAAFLHRINRLRPKKIKLHKPQHRWQAFLFMVKEMQTNALDVIVP